ncbi:MAG: ThuA domain-containing protein [Gemmataceae bacterium]
MRTLLAAIVVLIMGLVLNLAATFSEAPEKKIKVLIVDGYSNHDWKKTTELVKRILEPTGRFDVSVTTTPATANAPGWDDWRPRFADYDVVIQNTNDIRGGPSWPKPVQESFEKYVKDGGGVFILHSANNAFANWPAYNDIIGLGWRNKNQGVALSIDDKDGSVVQIPVGEGQNTGHGARIDAVLTRRGDHPIHKDLPRRWKTPGLEVYFYARGPAKNMEVLSYAFDPKTKLNWPIEWVITYGKGRVYNSTFGHVWKGDEQPPSMRCAGVQTILIRALEWLANRPVTYPVPKDFPDEKSLSLREKI